MATLAVFRPRRIIRWTYLLRNSGSTRAVTCAASTSRKRTIELPCFWHGTKTAENTSMEHSMGDVWRSEPSLREILLLWLVSFCLFVGFIAFLRNYFNLVDNFGDGSAYMSLASAIATGTFAASSSSSSGDCRM